MSRNRIILILLAITIPLLVLAFSVEAANVPSTVETADFGMVLSPSAWTLYPGQTAQATLEITATVDFTHPVGIEIVGLPPVTKASVGTNPIQPGSSATIFLTTTSYTAPGTYPFEVIGSAVITGGITSTHTVQASLTILPAEIDLSVSPSQADIFAGESAYYEIGVTATPGFTLPVSLQAGSFPTGWTYSFTPPSIHSGEQSSLVITTTRTTPAGNHPFSITGTSLAYSATVDAEVNVFSHLYLPVVLRRVPPVPYKPTLNTIQGADDGYFLLSWTETPARLAETYIVQEATDSTFNSGLKTVCNTNQQTCTIGSYTPGVYYYRVQGSNSWGTGAWSNTESATVQYPETPTLYAIDNPGGAGNYTVSWSSAARATQFTLQESASSSFSSPTTIYEGVGTSLLVSGRTGGTWYYRVYASGPTGYSGISNSQSVTVLYPQTPTLNVINNPNGMGDYTISWSASVGSASYTLQESTSSSFSSVTTIYQGVFTSISVNGRTAGTWYYRVYASGPTGVSSFSNVESTTVLYPDTPTLYAIDNPSGSRTYVVSWSSSARANSYTLQESSSSSFSNPAVVYQGPATSWTANATTSGTRYYRVYASGPTGVSGWSNTQSTTVQIGVWVVSSSAFVPYSGADSLYIVGEVANSTSSNIEYVRIFVTLRNSSGNVVGSDYTFSYIWTIAPGTTSPFLIYVSDPPSWATYELSVSWDTTSDHPHPLQILNQSTHFDSYHAFHVTGEAKNQYNEQRTSVTAYVTLYDQNHVVIGVDYIWTNPEDLYPGQTASFDVEVYFYKGKPNHSAIASYLLQVVDD